MHDVQGEEGQGSEPSPSLSLPTMCSADDERAGHPGVRVGTGPIRINAANEGAGSEGGHTPVEQGQGGCAQRGVNTSVGVKSLLTPDNPQHKQSTTDDSAKHNACGKVEQGEGGSMMQKGSMQGQGSKGMGHSREETTTGCPSRAMSMIRGCAHDPAPNQPRIAAVYPQHIGRNTPHNSLKMVGVAPCLKSTNWCHSQQESAVTLPTHTASGTETVGEADRALGMVPCGVCQACLVSPTCTPLAVCPPSTQTGTSPKHSPFPQPPRGGGEESTGRIPEGSQARTADWLRII